MIRVLFNIKGGVGKSSLTVNLAAISATQGQRTLLIDLDTQCNASQYLGFTDTESQTTTADLFEQTITFHLIRKPPTEFCQSTKYENLDLIQGSTKLAQLENELDSRHKIYKLRDALVELNKKYDQIYIDTPPALNFYSLSALIGSDSCLVPIDCDDFARKGLYSLQQKIDEIKEDHNPNLTIEGIVANQYLANAKLPNQIVNELIEEGYPVLPIYINQSVKMRESHQAKRPLIDVAPKHKLTQSLIELHNLLR
jgi:chromosome partitioning protein